MTESWVEPGNEATCTTVCHTHTFSSGYSHVKDVFLCFCFCFCLRMFCSMMDLKPNEQGEYEVAKGVSANIFRALLVRGGGKRGGGREVRKEGGGGWSKKEGRKKGVGYNVCHHFQRTSDKRRRGGERERRGRRGLSAKCVDHNLQCFPLPSLSPFLSFLLLLSPFLPSLLPSFPSFPPLQDYYKIGVVTCPSSESIQELREACDYLMIPFSEKTVRSQNLCKLARECS